MLALSRLAIEGTFKTTRPIPCRVAPDDADSTEISLSENVVRTAMSPVDELKSFLLLIESGRSVTDVAARFGVTEAVVSRRLALARVSPVLLEEYRSGGMNLEVLQAFTITDDHNVQESVWSELQPWDRNARTIRHMLSGSSTPATEKRVKFVGLSAYEQAGGIVRRDLFADGDQGAFVDDPAKLNRLVSEKCKRLPKAFRLKAGSGLRSSRRLITSLSAATSAFMHPRFLYPQEIQAKLSTLEQQRDNLTQQLDEGEADDGFDQQPLYDQIDEIEDQIHEIRYTQKRAYSEDVRAACGVVVSVGQNGEPEFVYGLLRKEDEASLAKSEPTSDDQASATEAPRGETESPAYSAALVESLTQHKTAAIAAELTAQPAIALAALVHALTLSEFALDLHLYRAKSSLHVSLSQSHLEGAMGSPAMTNLEEQHQGWLKNLPTDSDQLWRWCLRKTNARFSS